VPRAAAFKIEEKDGDGFEITRRIRRKEKRGKNLLF